MDMTIAEWFARQEQAEAQGVVVNWKGVATQLMSILNNIPKPEAEEPLPGEVPPEPEH